MINLERDLREIDGTFREKEIQWQTERTDLLNKISYLEQQSQQVSKL